MRVFFFGIVTMALAISPEEYWQRARALKGKIENDVRELAAEMADFDAAQMPSDIRRAAAKERIWYNSAANLATVRLRSFESNDEHRLLNHYQLTAVAYRMAVSKMANALAPARPFVVAQTIKRLKTEILEAIQKLKLRIRDELSKGPPIVL